MQKLLILLLLASCTQINTEASILGEWELVNYPSHTVQILDSDIIQNSETVIFTGHDITYTRDGNLLKCKFNNTFNQDSCLLRILNVTDETLKIEYDNNIFKNEIHLKRLK